MSNSKCPERCDKCQANNIQLYNCLLKVKDLDSVFNIFLCFRCVDPIFLTLDKRDQFKFKRQDKLEFKNTF